MKTKYFANLSRPNKIVGLLSVLLNFGFYLPYTITTVINSGGTWGFGYVFLPITFTMNLFIRYASLVELNVTVNQIFMVTVNGFCVAPLELVPPF